MLNTNTVARQAYLDQAAALLAKDTFTREDSARADRLIALADRTSDPKTQTQEERNFEAWIRSGLRRPAGGQHFTEHRDLNIQNPIYGGYLAPEAFRYQLGLAMKDTDHLLDRNIVTYIQTDSGQPVVIPALDDTQNAATVIAEGQQDAAEVDPILAPAQQSSNAPPAVVIPGYLALPPTWRTGFVKVSGEMLADSAFDPVSFLAAAFAVRFARGVGADLVSKILAGAKLGVTAAGSSTNTGGSETGGTSIGFSDLINTRKAVNPAYRQSPKCAWVMNDNTLAAIDGLLNKYGQPIFPPSYTASGLRRILGYPVVLCPSMPNIGLSNKPILFGDLSYVVVRVVKNSVGIRVYKERFIDYWQFGYRGFMRIQGALIAESYAQAASPILYLQNAAS